VEEGVAQPQQLDQVARDAAVSIPLRRVKKAYEQVADQIRDLITAGQIGPEERLPNEAELAARFGVSRATVREALRVLGTQNLIRTAKGSHGGSFVTIPSVANIYESLGTNIGLLSQSADVTLEEFLELRELLEVPAARLAAVRGDEAALERVRATIPGQPKPVGSEREFAYDQDFHAAVIQATDNTLLTIAAKPIFSALRTHLRRTKLGDDFHACVNRDHGAILAALQAGDGEAASGEMREHLAYLRPRYVLAWRYGRRKDAGRQE
jgi:GntR family transcriptional repressor for pyruvate dehydrogenase complex